MHDDSREWLEGLRLVGIALVSALLTASVVIAVAETLRPAVAAGPERSEPLSFRMRAGGRGRP